MVLVFQLSHGLVGNSSVHGTVDGSRSVGSNPFYDCAWNDMAGDVKKCSEFVSVGDTFPREINSKGLSKPLSKPPWL